MVRSLRDSPYRLKLDDLAEMTVNEIVRHLSSPGGR
jgi:hypothetical protein